MNDPQAVPGLIISLSSLLIIGFAGYFFFRPRKEPGGPFGAVWSPGEAIVITIAVYLVSQLLALIAMNSFVGSLIVELVGPPQSATMYTFVAMALFELFMLFFIFTFLRQRKARLGTIGLLKPRAKDVAYALSGYAVYFVVYLAIFSIAQRILPQIDFNQSQELGFDPAVVSGIQLLPVFVGLVVLAPVVEEIVFRGFLYSGLRTRLNKLLSAVLVSAIFAAPHLQAGSGNPLLWIAAIDTFVLSLIMVYLREKTGGLTAPILVHMIKNGVAFSALFIFKVT